MEITFNEVPPGERTPLPVRQEFMHLPSFAPPGRKPDGEGTEDKETDDEEGACRFSYFPRQKPDSETPPDPEVAIPQAWPDVGEETMKSIIDRLEEW